MATAKQTKPKKPKQAPKAKPAAKNTSVSAAATSTPPPPNPPEVSPPLPEAGDGAAAPAGQAPATTVATPERPTEGRNAAKAPAPKKIIGAGRAGKDVDLAQAEFLHGESKLTNAEAAALVEIDEAELLSFRLYENQLVVVTTHGRKLTKAF